MLFNNKISVYTYIALLVFYISSLSLPLTISLFLCFSLSLSLFHSLSLTEFVFVDVSA